MPLPGEPEVSADTQQLPLPFRSLGQSRSSWPPNRTLEDDVTGASQLIWANEEGPSGEEVSVSGLAWQKGPHRSCADRHSPSDRSYLDRRLESFSNLDLLFSDGQSGVICIYHSISAFSLLLA